MPITIQGLDDCNSPTHSSYSVTINGHEVNTVVTHTPSIVDEYISDVLDINSNRLNHLIVGLDIEWRPSFNRTIEHPVATLQLCVGHRCLIFQLIYATSMPQSLIDFLNNPTFRFVGVGIEEDVEKLLLDYELMVANRVELRNLAVEKLGKKELKNAGLKDLAKEVVHIEIQKPKKVTMSRWDVEYLDYDQIQYACVDAFLSFEIGKKLISGN